MALWSSSTSACDARDSGAAGAGRGAAQLSFYAMRGKVYRLRVTPARNVNFGAPYHIFIDVKRDGLKHPALPL